MMQEVPSGMECGLVIKLYDYHLGDIVEGMKRKR